MIRKFQLATKSLKYNRIVAVKYLGTTNNCFTTPDMQMLLELRMGDEK